MHGPGERREVEPKGGIGEADFGAGGAVVHDDGEGAVGGDEELVAGAVGVLAADLGAEDVEDEKLASDGERNFPVRLDGDEVAAHIAMAIKAVQGGYASAGLLAWIALSKYVDHQPLYRLEQQSARWGARVPRQTMADWIRITAEWLEPIYRQMYRRLLAGNYLQADEIPVQCNDPDEKKGRTSEGWLWAISRPGEDVVFDWRLSRRHSELASLIEGYRSILQSDAYGAYEAYAKEHLEFT